MNWRSPRFWGLVAIVCFGLVLGAVLFIFSQLHGTANKHAIPPPDPAKTTYTNPAFMYTMNYPIAWHLNESSDKSHTRVFLTSDKAAPEAVAFDINCFANPGKLDAQTFWQQTKSPQSNETGVGLTTFSSGVSAYVANGQGQTPYTVYTLVKQTVACQIISYSSDSANAKAINDTINNFTWQ
jgi:hypothetical protein